MRNYLRDTGEFQHVYQNGKRFEGVTAWYGNGELGLRFVTDGV